MLDVMPRTLDPSDACLSVPDDLSITGFDDADFAAFCTPALTTVRVPVYQMGCGAVEVLLKAAANTDAAHDGDDSAPRRELLPSDLIIRRSGVPASGACPAVLPSAMFNLFPRLRRATINREFYLACEFTCDPVGHSDQHHRDPEFRLHCLWAYHSHRPSYIALPGLRRTTEFL